MPMGSPRYRPEPKSACRWEDVPMLLTMLAEPGSTGRSDAVPRQNELAGVTLQLVPPLSGENGMHPAVIRPSPTRATTEAAPTRVRVLMATHRRRAPPP